MIKTDESAASVRAVRPHDLDRIREAIDEVEKVVVGQRSLIRKMFIALLADGHVLLEGAPGLAKRLLASAVGQAIGGTFRRIQMVPDMMPSDIVGTYLYVNGRFEVEKGPGEAKGPLLCTGVRTTHTRSLEDI